MKKRRTEPQREKPRTCDPYMCERCEDLGGGDFICTFDPEHPEGLLVCHNWHSTPMHQWCKKKGRAKQRRQYSANRR